MSALLALLAVSVWAAPPVPPIPPVPPVPPVPPGMIDPADDENILRGDWDRASGKRITLSDEHESADEILAQIAETAGWNIVLNTGREGDRAVIINMKDAPVEEAMAAVLRGTRLVAMRIGNTVTVTHRAAADVLSRPTLSGLDAPSGKKITADFKNAPVDRALREIADAAGLALVLAPEIEGQVNAHFKDTPVEDALRAVLGQADLAAVKEGTVLTVTRGAEGPRVVIRAGRHHFSFQGGELPDPEEIEKNVEKAMRRQGDGGGASGDRVVTGDVTIGPGQAVGQLVVLRGTATLETGAHADEVVAVFGSVAMGPGAGVEGDVVAVGGDIHLAPGANIGGSATSVGGQLVLEPGASIEGEQVGVGFPGLRGVLGLVGAALGLGAALSPMMMIGNALILFVMLFVLALLLQSFLPARLESVAATLASAPLKAALVGMLGLLALPLLTLLLVATIVGIPLVPLEILAVAAASVLGFAALAVMVGRLIPLKMEKGRSVAQLALGVLIIVVITEIPVLGTMAWMVAWLVVFGAVLRSRFGQNVVAAPPASEPPGTMTRV